MIFHSSTPPPHLPFMCWAYKTTFGMHVGQIARRSAYQVYARLVLSLLCLQVSRPCSNFSYFASQLDQMLLIVRRLPQPLSGIRLLLLWLNCVLCGRQLNLLGALEPGSHFLSLCHTTRTIASAIIHSSLCLYAPFS